MPGIFTRTCFNGRLRSRRRSVTKQTTRDSSSTGSDSISLWSFERSVRIEKDLAKLENSSSQSPPTAIIKRSCGIDDYSSSSAMATLLLPLEKKGPADENLCLLVEDDSGDSWGYFVDCDVQPHSEWASSSQKMTIVASQSKKEPEEDDCIVVDL